MISSNASECLDFVFALKMVNKNLNTYWFVCFKYLFSKQVHIYNTFFDSAKNRAFIRIILFCTIFTIKAKSLLKKCYCK